MKKVFKNKSLVASSALIIAGGALLWASNEKFEERNKEIEYSHVTQKSLEELIITEDQLMKPYTDIKDEAEKRHQEFLRKEKLRMQEIQRKIDAEVARIKEKDRQEELARQRAIAEEKRKNELARQAHIAEQQKQQNAKQSNNTQQVNKSADTGNQSGWMTFNVSYYGNNCSGCSSQGLTASGINVSNTIYYKGYQVIAADTSILPMGTLIEINTPNGIITGVIGDRGGAIKGYKLDVLVKSEEYASTLGRHDAKVRVVGKININ